MDELTSRSIGPLIRARRLSRGLTLESLAKLVGCTKSYLSGIENEKRVNSPSDKLLRKLEASLGFESGELIEIALWHATPASVRRHVAELQSKALATRKLLAMLTHATESGHSGETGERIEGSESAPQLQNPSWTSLDLLHRSGRLKRLIDAIAPPSDIASVPPPTGALTRNPNDARHAHADITPPLASMLPVEIPLINSVAAGYPAEFTDLGYPARVADQYVRAPDVHDPDAFAARVVGDSMLPDYREGDIVIFSPARPVKDGMDCFARLEPDHETTFKRVYFEHGERGESDARIRLQPLNPAFRAKVLPREDVAGLYAAVSVMRML